MNNPISLSVKDCAIILSQLAEQIDTELFMAVIDSAVQIHCETHDISTQNFYKDITAITDIVEGFLDV